MADPSGYTVLEIQGMTCMKCVEHVTRALEGVDGVESARVELEPGRATIRIRPGATVETESLAAAVRDAGYDAGLLAE